MRSGVSSLLHELLIITVVMAGRAFSQSDAASLTIRFAGGTSQFHVGEVIPLELSFTASLPDACDMDTRNYDRSGRLNLEQFEMTPSGRDPLANYYAVGVFLGGGLGSSQVLSRDPQVMKEDLNEWVALDDPGHYTVHVNSTRVSRRGATKDEPLQLRSNTLEFDVVEADPEWQEQTLAAAVSVLNSGLRRFHQLWSSRENELTDRRGMPRDASDAMGFQYGLVESLARAQGWLLSDEQVTQLENLTLGSQRDNVKQYHWTSPVELSLDLLFDGQVRADINHQYFSGDVASLRAKLGQYPGGTKFRLVTLGEEDRLAPVLKELNEAAVEHGLVMELAH
jgi:hypothetical protein